MPNMYQICLNLILLLRNISKEYILKAISITDIVLSVNEDFNLSYSVETPILTCI